MKLLEFKRIKDKENKYGIDPDGEYDWFVHLETFDEHYNYQRYEQTIGSDMTDRDKDYQEGRWAGYMSAKLDDIYSDNDIFYYFSPEDKVPAVGEQWELDGLVFERTK